MLHCSLPCPMDLQMSQFAKLVWHTSPSFLLLRFSCSYSLVSSPRRPTSPPPPSNYISTTDHSFSINRYFVFTYTSFETTPLKVGLWSKSSAATEFSCFLKTLRTELNCWSYVMRLRSCEACSLFRQVVNTKANLALCVELHAFSTGSSAPGAREVCIVCCKCQVERG
jgi:hypothetical protein